MLQDSWYRQNDLFSFFQGGGVKSRPKIVKTISLKVCERERGEVIKGRKEEKRERK